MKYFNLNDKKLPIQENEFPVQAWGVLSSNLKHEPLIIPRGKLSTMDIKIDILYSGICHSDIHTGMGHWGNTRYPFVGGHEF